MKDLLVGRFIPGKSLLYQLDARVKLVSLLLLLLAIIMAETARQYLLLLGAIGMILVLSAIPVRAALGSLVRMWQFFLIVFLMNAFFFTDANPLWTWGIFHLSFQGLAQGANVVVRILLVMVLSNILTCTTAPMEITFAGERLLRPLGCLHVPVEEVAMIVSVAIQFIPILGEEAQMIRKAQIARGARFESKNLLERATSLFPLVIPLFLAAFRRADELSLAMEARGYKNARERTRKRPEPLHAKDYLFLGSILLLSLFSVSIRG
ncbi:MAG: energy-coupling factor transporter transmembrane component T [Sphaerochaetaceae bacterium]